MLLPTDQSILARKGITESAIEEQLRSFVKGFPYLKIAHPIKPGSGLLLLAHDDLTDCLNHWDHYLMEDHRLLKFVPASGAATRMFKDLYEFIDATDDGAWNDTINQFFSEIKQFAFYDALNQSCKQNLGKDIETLTQENEHKKIIEQLLFDSGLNYGSLPKGLLLFHNYADEKRTAFQEHLAEGVLYAQDKNNNVNIHFTVSGEHRHLFEQHLKDLQTKYESQLGVKFHISFSEQKASTDTIAATERNEPFRENGELVFRPGGHGALIENLNDLDADIIFIKNIDNVVPDALKNPTIIYKKMIAGLLVKLQKKSFEYLRELESGPLESERLLEIASFCEHKLNNINPQLIHLAGSKLQEYLIKKLNRPIRVCGMVKNTGEPGGGPFLTMNPDGTLSPQILESSQINLSDVEEKNKMSQSTHFNPVDLVCGTKNYKGEKFDLLKHVDKNTGFISLKSKNGKALKALELPGLWNGAMSDWNTIFVEVPIATFNPVKTVNDLLRVEHQ